MKKAEIRKDQLGKHLKSAPKEGGRLNRSLINYHIGIPELDEFLKNKPFSELNAEFGIDLYDNVVLFMLYRGDAAVWAFPILRNNIAGFKALHDQELNIRKNSVISGGTLGVIAGIGGVLGAVVAGTVDALTTNKGLPKDQLVQGSLFDIYVKTENEEIEKIVISTTNNHKEKVEVFLKSISESKK